LFVAILAVIPSSLAQAPLFDPFDSQHGPPHERKGDLSGTVYVDQTNMPAAKVPVHIRSLNSGFFETVLTDYGGRFELHGIPPGSYQVSVDEPGYERANAMAQVNAFHSEVSLYVKSRSASPPNGSPAGSASVVSVRDLKIPSKAQNEFHRGLERLGKSDIAGSLVHFNKATAAFPDYYEAFYEIGVAEAHLNHEDNALQALQKAIDLSGGHYPLAQFAYGLLLANRGNPVEAERIIRAGLETGADLPEGHVYLAIALLRQNRIGDAEKCIREALLRRPQYADAYFALGDVHHQRKDYQAEIQDLDMYLKLSPSGSSSDHVRQLRETAKQQLSAPSPQN